MPGIDGRIGVSVAHWSIHGLADKLDDDNFKDFVNKFDICFLTETWKEGIVNMSGKIVIRKDAKKIVNKRGRKSGGILALIDTEIKKGITIVENNIEYGIWLRLHKNYFMTENDIYLCGIYLPPGDSPYAIMKLFEVKENDICTFSNLGKVIIIGDTNGRVGEEPDFILPDKYNTAFPWLNFDYFPQKRISMDIITNKQGKQLLKLCKNTGMIIVNGRVLGDIPGAITVHNKQGCSTVDHAIISHELLHKVSYFKANAPNQYSDHSLIQLKLNLKRNMQNEKLPLHPIPPGYKWDQLRLEKFQSALESPYCQSIANEILNTDYPVNISGVNDIGHDTTNLIKTVADLTLKRKKLKTRTSGTSNQTIKKNVAINQLYQNMRKELNSIGRLLMQFPRDPYLRGRFFQLKKSMKSNLKKAKIEQCNSILDKIQESESKDPYTFWKLVNEIRRKKRK